MSPGESERVKERCSSAAVAVSPGTSLCGNQSQDTSRRRKGRDVVQAYGTTPSSSQQLYSGVSHAASRDRILEGDGSLIGRRRDWKGSRPPESYVSTPSSGHDNDSPAAAFYPDGDMREGGSKIQAEQISQEALLRGTNNYASLLSSPGPSSIPSPSFKKKLSNDFAHSLSSEISVSLSQPVRRLEGNSVQFIMSPPSPGSESSQILDVEHVENASPIMAVSILQEDSLVFDVQSPECFSRPVSLELEDLMGDQSSDTEASTPPGVALSDSSASNFVEHVGVMSIVKAEQKESSNNNLLLKEASAVDPAVPRIRSLEAKRSENAQARMVRESPPVGRRKLKHTDAETAEVTPLRRLGAHVTGPRQIPAGKGPKRTSSPGNGGSSLSQPQSTGKLLHWKAVPGVPSKDGSVSLHLGVPSIGSTGDGLVGSPHSWPGPESTLLGSPFRAPSTSRVESTAGLRTGIRTAWTCPKTKVFPEHWSPEEVSKAMEAGQVFKACFRINSHNRSEAYVTVEGVPLDILIYGVAAQNRAMEGDIVAITLERMSSWPRLKGSLNKQVNSESSSSKEGAMEFGKTISMDAHSSQETVIDNTEAQCQDRDTGANGRVLDEGEMTLEAHHPQFVQDKASNNQMHMKQETRVLPIEVSCDGSSQAFEKHTEGSSNTVIQILKLGGGGLTPGVGLQSLAQSNVEKEEVSHPRPGMVATAVASLASLVMLCPGRRPTGKVVAILEKSPRREAVVGFLETLQHSGNKAGRRGQQESQQENPSRRRSMGIMLLVPVDNRYPKMLVFSACLPDDLYERLKEGDATMLTELVAARVDGWHADSHLPTAVVKMSLGQGGQIEAQLKAILFEHGVHSAVFSQDSLDCLPKIPWKISPHEIKRRVDLRGQRIFSIDPPTARDLDDALSFECLKNGVVRVGVHIADVSYFVSPNTALDKEAQSRSTSVYLEQQVIPMLPHLLCEELCSLNPGVDRLAFSIIWSISPACDILDQWIGKTIIQSCVKLTYGHAQNMIDGVFTDLEEVQAPSDMQEAEPPLPKVHGKHTWQEVVADVQALHDVAKKLRNGRFERGALKLNNSKLMFSLDEDGAPYESTMLKTKDSNFVVEEFMLLANMSVARVISNAFPDSALLRRHPEPNMRKLKEFEDFCDKNGFELDASSSGALHISLEKMQERFKDDPAVFNILMLLATKPMQLAKYFCTGELKDKEEEWSHYALATPLYTHFTSPIRRYPDILVHRMLAAALEAEEVMIQGESSLPCSRGKHSQALSLGLSKQLASKCFSAANATKEATSMPSAQQALASAATKYRLPGIAELAVIATHCNERKVASRNVKDASDKLYLWTMLKKKQGLLSNARVLALGSKFMSLYICKVAMERRIYYEEIEGVNAEWFAATGTLVLDISPTTIPKKWSNDSKPGRQQRTVADIATVVNPTDIVGSSPEEESYEDIIREVEERLAGKICTDDISADFALGENHPSSEGKVEPAVLPLTLRLFSTVPVSLHAAGGGNQPLDITVKLYISSYVTT